MDLTEFEKDLIINLRELSVTSMSYPGSITIHYDDDICICKVEIIGIRKELKGRNHIS